MIRALGGVVYDTSVFFRLMVLYAARKSIIIVSENI